MQHHMPSPCQTRCPRPQCKWPHSYMHMQWPCHAGSHVLTSWVPSGSATAKSTWEINAINSPVTLQLQEKSNEWQQLCLGRLEMHVSAQSVPRQSENVCWLTQKTCTTKTRKVMGRNGMKTGSGDTCSKVSRCKPTGLNAYRGSEGQFAFFDH